MINLLVDNVKVYNRESTNTLLAEIAIAIYLTYACI